VQDIRVNVFQPAGGNRLRPDHLSKKSFAGPGGLPILEIFHGPGEFAQDNSRGLKTLQAPQETAQITGRASLSCIKGTGIQHHSQWGSCKVQNQAGRNTFLSGRGITCGTVCLGDPLKARLKPMIPVKLKMSRSNCP
jgi:hypothetical protein